MATEHGGAELAAALGLAIDPFASDALPDFFFVGGRRRFLAQQTTHALYFSGSLVLLVGAAGAGKSRVLDEVCRELAALVDICRIEATVLADAVEIRGQLVHVLHLPVSAAEDNDQLLLALDRLQSAAAEPLPVALVIDDAHLLGVPVLAACQRLEQASGGRLRLLLAGEQELLTAWQQLGADADADVIELPPLDRQEVADYLNTRLQAAGLRRELPLSALQLEELHRHSSGNIGALHTLLPAVMAPATPGGARKSLLQGLPLPHIGAVAALVAVVSLALWVGGDDDDEAPTAVVDAAGRRAVPLALPGLARESGAAEQPAAQGSVVVTRPLERPQTTATVSAPVPLPIQRSPQAERDVANAGAHTPAPAPAPAPARAEPAARPAAAPVPAPKPAPAPAPKPVAAKPPVPAPAPQKPAAAKPEAPKPAAQPAVNATLLAMPANQYMVQLLAAHNKGKVDSYVAVARRTLKVHVYETRRSGKPWYVVVAGPYRDQAAARAAIAGLPKGLSEGQPWLRSVASVHADLRASG